MRRHCVVEFEVETYRAGFCAGTISWALNLKVDVILWVYWSILWNKLARLWLSKIFQFLRFLSWSKVYLPVLLLPFLRWLWKWPWHRRAALIGLKSLNNALWSSRWFVCVGDRGPCEHLWQSPFFHAFLSILSELLMEFVIFILNVEL
jgi:hypothetical protein